MTILRDLLEIKTYRERKAELAVMIRRSAFAEALRARDTAAQRLDEFRDWAFRKERELYGDLCTRTVRLRDIQDVHLSVGAMRGEEREHQRGFDEAETQRGQTERELDQSRAAHLDASRLKERFVELVRLHAQEQLLALERKEDAEMEEVAEARRERMEWDDGAEVSP